MRYTSDHKRRTRARIVRRAGRLFRRYGYDGIGIDAIMAAAKLTRGGFYGHFRSKDHLFAEVLREEQDLIVRLKERPARTTRTLRQQALAVAMDYLHPNHGRAVGTGCPMAALSNDVARAGTDAQHAYAEKLDELAAEFARGLDQNEDEAASRAMACVALCIGGLTLARAAGDGRIARQIYDACTTAIARELDVGRPTTDESA